jgi:hypothetical protein
MPMNVVMSASVSAAKSLYSPLSVSVRTSEYALTA